MRPRVRCHSRERRHCDTFSFWSNAPMWIKLLAAFITATKHMVAYKLYFVKYKQISSIDINNIICYADLQQFTNVGISMAEEINKDAGEVLKAFRRDLDIRSAAVRT